MTLANLIPGVSILKMAGVGAVALAVGFGAGYVKGRSDGAALAELKPLRQTIEDIRERNQDDAATQRLSDYQLCVRDLGKLPECETLR